jgi:type I restriction enzyme M protein
MSRGISQVNRDLKNFESLFNQLVYRHESVKIFDDLLTQVVCCFGFGTNEELYFQTIKPYKREELDIFARLLGELLYIYSEAKAENRWVDPLGDFYEFLSSSSKKSALGQFFTPPAVCDLIAHVNKGEWGKIVNEPCCGSGRLVLAMNKVVKGHYYVCQDLDPMCAKMAAINLAMHEIKAEIHCMDTMRMDDLRFSFYVNYDFWKLQMPHIIMKYPSH